jgi:hypothetical protein
MINEDFYDYKKLALEYFYRFTLKDLSAVSDMFSEDIRLHDWENDATGKKDVVSVYEKIFNGVDTIAVTPAALYKDSETVVAELVITINGKERILVTDVLSFDTDGKIESVRAYKG